LCEYGDEFTDRTRRRSASRSSELIAICQDRIVPAYMEGRRIESAPDYCTITETVAVCEAIPVALPVTVTV
jgi:hypothetical protein